MAKWFTSKLSRPGSDCVILEGDDFKNKLVATAASAEVAKAIVDQHNAVETAANVGAGNLAKIDHLRDMGRRMLASDNPEAVFWSREAFNAANYLIEDPICNTYQLNAVSVIGHLELQLAPEAA